MRRAPSNFPPWAIYTLLWVVCKPAGNKYTQYKNYITYYYIFERREKENAQGHFISLFGGLDGLRDRLSEYRELGAKFAKWRAVITIGDNIPSQACIEANAHALARYAGLCQEAGIVPMVEPEVLMDADNTIEKCYEVTEATLIALFNQLKSQDISIERTILKVNMVVSGKQCPTQAGVQEVADMTVRCLHANVPAELPGIVFLSGGQTPELATAHLNAMNASNSNMPWPLSFSYGRALQAPCIAAWSGKAENLEAAKAALLHREKCNSLACSGKYSDNMDKVA